MTLQLKGGGKTNLQRKSAGKCWALGWTAGETDSIQSVLSASCLSSRSVKKLMDCVMLCDVLLRFSAPLLSMDTNVSHANLLNCWQQSKENIWTSFIICFLLSADFDLHVFIYKGFRNTLEKKQCTVSIFYLSLLADADLLSFLQSQNYSRSDL